MVEFFRTAMGHKFYEGTMPQIARALTEIARKMPEPQPEPKADPRIPMIIIPKDPDRGLPSDFYLGLPEGMPVHQWHSLLQEVFEKAAPQVLAENPAYAFPVLEELLREAGFSLPNWISVENSWGAAFDHAKAEQEGE